MLGSRATTGSETTASSTRSMRRRSSCTSSALRTDARCTDACCVADEGLMPQPNQPHSGRPRQMGSIRTASRRRGTGPARERPRTRSPRDGRAAAGAAPCRGLSPEPRGASFVFPHRGRARADNDDDSQGSSEAQVPYRAGGAPDRSHVPTDTWWRRSSARRSERAASTRSRRKPWLADREIENGGEVYAAQDVHAWLDRLAAGATTGRPAEAMARVVYAGDAIEDLEEAAASWSIASTRHPVWGIFTSPCSAERERRYRPPR